MADDFTKDPDATLDWKFNWVNWLDVGESISASTFIVTPGLTVTSTPTPTASTATVWLTGGRIGQVYRVTNRITTSAGRTDDRSITIRVRDR